MRKGENSAQKKRPQRERGERQGRPTSGECVIGGSPEAQNRLFSAPIRSKQSVLIHQNETAPAPARGAEAVGGLCLLEALQRQRGAKLRADEQEPDRRRCRPGRAGQKPRSSRDQGEAA
jgi:hypothetical protein